MSRKQNDRIGTIAGIVLICVVVAVMVGGLAILQAQEAIDAVKAQQQAMACFQHPRACLPEPKP